MPGIDEASFDDAFATLFPAAYRVALRILGGDRAGAEDIAAEALARAYARWRRVGNLPYRDAWVLRVAANLALNHVKRKRPTPEETESVSIEDIAATRVTLIAALNTLPARQREVIVLRHLSGLSEDEVARALGIGPGTVKTHMRRGLAALRRRLGDTRGPEIAT